MQKNLICRSLQRAIFIFPVIFFLFGFFSIVQADSTLIETQATSVTTNLGIFGGDNWDIAVDGDYVYTTANGVPNGFFYSIDSGENWQRPAGTNDYGAGFSVEVDTISHTVYISLGGDLYMSTDRGATLTKIADNSNFALLYAQSKLIYGYNDTIYVSADGGTTFTSAVVASDETITDIAASATEGTFYAVSRTSGNVSSLYRSTDSGATWTAITVTADSSTVTNFTDIDTNPADANVLTIGTNNYLWLSLDAGATWSQVGVSPERSCGPASTWTPTRWYACSGYSTDNGATWTDMDTHTNVMRGPGKIITFNAADESIMYGDCMSGVCKSTNGGLTWMNSLDGITGVNVLAISQTTNKSTVWISSSNGLGKTTNFTDENPSWTWPILPCDEAVRCDSSGIGEAVWVKPDDANIVLAGSIGGYIYRSTDGGTTWSASIPSAINIEKFTEDDSVVLRPKYFLSDPSNTNTVYLALYGPKSNDYVGAVLKSTDAGITWTDLELTNDAPATVMSITEDGSLLYVGTGYDKLTNTQRGLYQHNGSTWTKLSGIEERLNITGVMVDPEVQTSVYVAASNDLAPEQLDAFYYSTDSGSNWTKITPTGYVGFGPITVQTSTNPNTLYMSARDNDSHGVLLKSSDRGVTWGALYTGLKSESFTTMLFDGLVAGNKQGVFSIKSMAKFKGDHTFQTKKDKPVILKATVKDAATNKKLTKKTIHLYRKKDGKWEKYKSALTNNSGIVTFSVKSNKSKKYQMRWKPKTKDKEEYATSSSSTFKVTI